MAFGECLVMAFLRRLLRLLSVHDGFWVIIIAVLSCMRAFCNEHVTSIEAHNTPPSIYPRKSSECQQQPFRILIDPKYFVQLGL